MSPSFRPALSVGHCDRGLNATPVYFLKIGNGPVFILNARDDLPQEIGITERVAVDVRPNQLLERIRRVSQFERWCAHRADLCPIDQGGEKAAAILSRVKPVDGFFSETEIVKTNRRDIDLRKSQLIPRLLHFRDRGDELGFALRREPFAEGTGVDRRALGIVVGRYVDLDVARVRDSLGKR